MPTYSVPDTKKRMVVLDGPLDRIFWIKQIQKYAESRFVREYCDPEQTKELGDVPEPLTAQETKDTS
jgi:hypothetical protein